MIAPLNEVADEQAVVAAALRLPASSRLSLAEELWLSVDESAQEEVAAAWAEELERRLVAIESGQNQRLAGEEVMSQLIAKYTR